MGFKQSKQTKKFEKNNLARTIKQRKIAKKNKWNKEKLNRKNDEEEEKEEEVQQEEEEEQQSGKKQQKKQEKKAIEELNVDEFMNFDSDDEDDDDDEDDAPLNEDEADGDEDDDEADALAAAGLDDSEEEEEEEEDEDMDEKKAKGSDDDDESDVEDSDDDADIESIEKEAKELQATLDSLKEKDPSFYSYLEKTSKNLLEFEDSIADLDEEAESIADSVNKSGGSAEAKKKAMQKAIEKQLEQTNSMKDLTTSSLKLLKYQVGVKFSLRALKKLLRLFRSACHLGDDDKDDKTAANDVKISDSKIFNDLIRFCLKDLSKVFLHHLKSDTDNERVSVHPRFKIMEPLLRSYLGNLIHFLNSLAESKMIRFVLSHAEQTVPFFEPFPKLATKFLKSLLRVWSTSEDNARIDAFLRLRQLALELPSSSGMLEAALKGLYLSYVRHAKFMSQQSAPQITFMQNCVVEMYALDHAAAYQHAFVYIRQLAIHLRTAIMNKTKDSHKTVYNWQYVNCLRVWAKLLASQADSSESALYPLVYPLVQVILGCMELLPSAKYFPLRFTLASTIIDICRSCSVYVPLAPHLLAVLNSTQATKVTRGGGKGVNKAPALKYSIKANKQQLTTRQYQETVVGEAIRLLLDFYAVYSYSIAFPELALPTRLRLKKFSKSNHIGKVRKQLSQLIDKLDVNAQWVAQKRNGVNYAPKDLASKALSPVTTFAPEDEEASKQISPLQKYVLIQQQQLQTEEAEEEKKSKGTKRSKKEMAEEDEDEVEDMDEDADSDDEEERAPKKKSRVAEQKSKHAFPLTFADQDDEVEDLVLSDSEDDEEEEEEGSKSFGVSGLETSSDEEEDGDDEEEAEESD